MIVHQYYILQYKMILSSTLTAFVFPILFLIFHSINLAWIKLILVWTNLKNCRKEIQIFIFIFKILGLWHVENMWTIRYKRDTNLHNKFDTLLKLHNKCYIFLSFWNTINKCVSHCYSSFTTIINTFLV